MILVVDLLEVAVLTASQLHLVLRFCDFGKVALMTDQESILTKVLIGVKGIRLDSFTRHLLAQELHLIHLVVVKSLHIAIVRIGIGQRLECASFLVCTGRARPSLD